MFLVNFIYAEVNGAFVSGILGGVLVSAKLKYKREDVKPKRLEDVVKDKLNKRYPSIDAERSKAAALVDKEFEAIENLDTISDIQNYLDNLEKRFASTIITEENKDYYIRYPKPGITLAEDASLSEVRKAYRTYLQRGISGAGESLFQKASAESRRAKVKAAQKYSNWENDFIGDYPGNFRNTIIVELKDSRQADARRELSAFETAFTAGGIAAARQNGKRIIDLYASEKETQAFRDSIRNDLESSVLKMDDPLQAANKEYKKVQEDMKGKFTASEYTPPLSRVESGPLTSPVLSDDASEESYWEPNENEAKRSKAGIIYGVSAGYIKSLGSHNFAGGEVHFNGNTVKLRYDLQIKDSAAKYGEASIKTGPAIGISTIIGREINPAISMYARAGIELAKWKAECKLDNDSPVMENSTYKTQNFSRSIKPIFGGVGVMYNLGGWVIGGEYNYINYPRSELRKFEEIGEDKRRRGYSIAGKGHRVFFFVRKFFKIF